MVETKNKPIELQYTHLNGISEQDYSCHINERTSDFLIQKYDNFGELEESQQYFVSTVHSAFYRHNGDPSLVFERIFGFTDMLYNTMSDRYHRVVKFIVYPKGEPKNYSLLDRGISLDAQKCLDEAWLELDFVDFMKDIPLIKNYAKIVLPSVLTTTTDIKADFFFKICELFSEMEMKPLQRPKFYKKLDKFTIFSEIYNFAGAKENLRERKLSIVNISGEKCYLFYDKCN